MTNLKKLASVLLVFALLLTMVGTAVAAAPTATVTIKNMNGVAGGTYKMWKLLDATKSADGKNIAYTVSDTYRAQLITALGYTEDANKSKEENNAAIIAAIDALKSDAGKMRTFANTLFKALETLGTADFNTGVTTAVETQIPDVPYGYYLIGQTDLSAEAEAAGGNYAMASIKTITADLTIETKQDTPTHVKKIRDTNDSQNTNPKWEDSADYDFGDLVPFQIFGRVSKNIDQYGKYEFTFHDEMCDGLTFKPDTVKVFASRGGGSEYAVRAGFTVTPDADSHGFTLSFADLKTTALPVGMKDGSTPAKEVTSWADVKIVVYFSAELNTGAKIGAEGNPNVSYLEYSNDFNDQTSTGTTPPDKVTAFTFQLVVNKVDKENNPLTGAEFTLWKRIDLGIADEPARLDRETHNYEFQKVATISGDSSSKFTFKGLDDGYYKLEETKVPDGYNKASDVLFRIIADHDEESNDPKLTSLRVVDNDGQPFSSDPFTVDLTSGTITTNVVNLSGAELPETGGIGTTIFYVLGSLLVAAAVVLMVTKRRMAAKEN